MSAQDEPATAATVTRSASYTSSGICRLWTAASRSGCGHDWMTCNEDVYVVDAYVPNWRD